VVPHRSTNLARRFLGGAGGGVLRKNEKRGKGKEEEKKRKRKKRKRRRKECGYFLACTHFIFHLFIRPSVARLLFERLVCSISRCRLIGILLTA
jgi:hypothetical protein